MSIERIAGRLLAGALAGLLGTGCVSYGGISKANDGKVYLTGSTSFIIFSSSWVKRCTEAGNELTCEELPVKAKERAAAKARSDDAEDEEEDDAPRKKRRR